MIKLFKSKACSIGSAVSRRGRLVIVLSSLFFLCSVQAKAYISVVSGVESTKEGGVRGVIKDSDGEPIPGVAILIKGTQKGTFTDADGVFIINELPTDPTLVISFIGMKSQEIIVGSQTDIDVTMLPDAVGLDEVIAIGYTTRKKGEVTGSISTVDSKTIEKSGSKDLAKSLAGKVPGLIISDRGGYPGSTGDMTLLIRGKSTLNNNSPLILIDGIVASSFSHLSPQDIQSLSVLKDGAAAIYGARAANGVILITTKRGKTGKPQISLSSSFNMSTFSSTPKLMSSEQFAIYNNEIAERDNSDLPYSQEEIAKYASGEDQLNYPSTDWADLTFADFSPESRVMLSISGGSEYVNYFVSGDYISQVGMYESGDLKFNQSQVRSNLDIKLLDNLKLSIDLSGKFGVNQEPGVNASTIYKHIYTNMPTEVGIYPNGKVAWGGENGANPYIMSSDESGFVKKTDNDLRGKFSMDWNLNELTEGLKVKGFVGIRKMSNDIKSWYTPWTVYQLQEGTGEYIPQIGYSQKGSKRILRESFWKYNELMLNATVHYNRSFGDHTARGFIGVEQTTSDERTFWAERKGFPSDDYPDLFAGDDLGQQSNGSSSEWGRLNYFGSFSYDYHKRYFLDLTLRHDGSGNFGEGKRFGTFPGAAASWSIGDEAFMSGTRGWLDALKLRTSWAIMGNDRIASFEFLTSYEYGGNTNVVQPNYYLFGSPGTRTNGYSSSKIGNPDVTWEIADMKNIGVNFSLMNGKLSGDINYFYQKRKNILINRSASVPDMTGLNGLLPSENLGKVNNFGWEFQVNWMDKIGDVDYHIGANITQAKNEVVYLDEAVDVPDALKREGHSMDSYIVYPTAGLFRDQAELDATEAKLAGTVEGEAHYLDTNDDKKITSADRVRTYSSNVPEIQYGIHGGASYKGFDLNFLFQGQAKAEMLVFFEGTGALPDFMFDERWTTENRDARYPRAFKQSDPYSASLNTVDSFQGADFWLRDASFVRLKELELAYTFDKDQIEIGDLKLFVRGFNLFTFGSDIYDLGLDPEAEGYNSFRQSTYPSLKTFTAGFNFNF